MGGRINDAFEVILVKQLKKETVQITQNHRLFQFDDNFQTSVASSGSDRDVPPHSPTAHVVPSLSRSLEASRMGNFCKNYYRNYQVNLFIKLLLELSNTPVYQS